MIVLGLVLVIAVVVAAISVRGAASGERQGDPMLARKIILGFGFAVLMPMLIHYGIDVFVAPVDSRAHYQELQRLREREEDAGDQIEKARLREERYSREQRYEAHHDQAGRLHFFIGAPIGIVVTLVGSFVKAQAIGGGLMLGGIFTFTGGCAWYWADLSRQGRFLVLLVAFAVLLWIGYQRLSELKRPSKSS
ncbi:MAG TPA: hypothetical protein DDX89_05205 [Candidatus Omnitrophica bacterium]|nr:MAG: hypothetical protein A2Z92_00565 [Omnitrophica WOR_2 bacterium GWA2_63_20]OGX32457.1 MAG: hypothetical protein A3E56_03645 [Omnitrophica WOR_2 bacterium RIFCSPHIGHO2_12_FULL_64_13]OGX36271.1 MAG: hypothetical protein A3B73_03255 [Omnitrophica WOR_2 bacterium RIFCSPHIGHO2_02_FULL_63_39]OGX46122.1 MAG: hypothetical protein A3I71_06595 [Omnitrophica WOR_2 bacterium RIFCSPLOWO2_02_FULL_63_16]HBH97173.1 hypothetical protein [Candidatus Omnitrophota bacterium]